MNETETTWKVKGLFKANAQNVANEISEIGDDVSPAEIVERARNENKEEAKSRRKLFFIHFLRNMLTQHS